MTTTTSDGITVRAARPKNTTRQDHQAATRPASGGPVSDGMIQQVLISARAFARSRSG